MKSRTRSLIISERGAPAASRRVSGSPSAFTRFAYWLVGLAARPYGPAFEGLERIPASGRAIIACNHRHWMDTIVVALVVWRVRFPRFLGKEERRGDVAALKQALAVLEGEGCLMVFPEGTRSRTGQPLKPKAGIGFLAYKTGALVVPVRVRDTELFPKPVTMRADVGEPLRYSGDGSRESCQGFAEEVMQRIYAL